MAAPIASYALWAVASAPKKKDLVLAHEVRSSRLIVWAWCWAASFGVSGAACVGGGSDLGSSPGFCDHELASGVRH